MKRTITSALALVALSLSVVGYGAYAHPVPGLASAVRSIRALTPVPQSLYSYWLSECEVGHWPAIKGAIGDLEIEVVAHKVTPRHAWGLLRRDQYIGSLEAHNLGSRVDGYYLWTVRAPKHIMAAFWATEQCPTNRRYDQVLDLPAAPKAWVMERSTCYGAATWRGRAYTVWPCVWSTERAGEGSVTTLSGIGPGIMSGGSGAEAAGIEETP